MTDAIAHRGPDGEGQWCEGSVGLGHRRLAIIDLSQEAAQPMHSLDGRYVITYNGEVYNFLDLRRELERTGSRFRSHSDTEVVLEAVIRWGIESAIQRFNGMFAFAVWDRETHRLLLGRDRYGIKPLYLYSTPSAFLFASEPKAIRTHKGFAARLDYEGLAEYLTYQNILSERTLLEGLRVFPRGSFGEMALGTGSSDVHLKRYWEPRFTQSTTSASLVDVVSETERLLRQAVSRQMVSDVEVGSFLSGGIDSSSIVAIASQSTPGLKTFTCGFDMTRTQENEAGFDERRIAERLSRGFGTEHYEILVGPNELRRCIDRLTFHLEEPRVGQSYPNFYAAKLAGRFVKVCLSGVGGDEIFGGYPWRYMLNAAPQDFFEQHFRLWNRLGGQETVQGLMKPSAPNITHHDARESHRQFLGTIGLDAQSAPEMLAAVLEFEAGTFLPGLLAVEDRLSMAHGLEVRIPFLDNDLVDFALTLPPQMRLERSSRPRSTSSGAIEAPLVGKYVLRLVSEAWVPSELAFAAKQGFSGPDASWFARENADLVRSAAVHLPENVFDVDFAIQSVEAHVSGRQPNRLLMWSILSLSTWFAQNL
jgi:asparagine synthase (glutamine-hydrolysing)